MTARIFALIIGIDNYLSGRIWNLQSCVDDAKNVKRWLTQDLNTPRDQVLILLDSEATKQRIEDSFMSHLVNNSAIEYGEAILIYFAGHGSSLPSPPDWFQNDGGKVDVLCPYDHDTKGPNGRIAGISDRSMHALISELCEAKGDNITLIFDCCFSPPFRSRMNMRDRQFTRWTPTTRASPEDLYLGLWRGALGRDLTNHGSFFHESHDTHTLLAACKPGGRATEGKEGGRFTIALLEAKKAVALHRTTYVEFINRLAHTLGTSQQPLCLGKNKDRILFRSIPFVPDSRYVSVNLEEGQGHRVDAGAIHGVVKGSEFSVHGHNYRGSLNPPLANLRVLEVHPTWSLARCTSEETLVPRKCWAQITRWNNRTPFRVHLKRSWLSFFKRWRIHRELPSKAGDPPSKGGLNVLRVRNHTQADISLRVGCRSTKLERNDDTIAANARRVIRVEEPDRDLDLIDAAARFHLHLHRQNSDKPLRDLITMELYRLDPTSWIRMGDNLLKDGKANLVYERGAIYSIVMRNQSDTDLWPYLACMDPNGYDINLIYYPDASSITPPLQKHGILEVGTGAAGSEALSFTLPDHEFLDSALLKLFVSSTYTPMTVIEQGRPVALLDDTILRTMETPILDNNSDSSTELWDTVFTSVTFRK